MKSHANKLAVAVAACSLSLSGLTQAQKLEEVVVTAAKVEASIQDTPIAVSAFSQEQLDAQLINDASAMQFSVPNLTQTKGNFTAGDIRIRGIGSGAVGTFRRHHIQWASAVPSSLSRPCARAIASGPRS